MRSLGLHLYRTCTHVGLEYTSARFAETRGWLTVGPGFGSLEIAGR